MRGHLVIAILFFILFLASVDNQMLIPFLPMLERELGVPFSWVGSLISAYAFSAAFFNLFLGPLTDRFGRVLFFRLGLLLFAATAIGAWNSSSFGGLLGVRAVTGLSAGLLSTCVTSYVGDQFEYARRGRVMGILLSSYFAALIFGIPAGAAIAQAWGWRWAFLMLAGIALLLAGATFLLPPDRRRGSQNEELRRWWATYGFLLRQPSTMGALWVSFAVSGATLSFLTYISPYLSQRFGLDSLQISKIFLVAGLAAIVGSPASGWLCDRLGKRRVFLVSNSLLPLPLLLLTRFTWGLSLFSVLFLITLAVAFRQTALQTVQTELTSREHRGTYIALRNGFSQLGIGLSVLLSGRLYSWQGYSPVLYLAAFLTILASLLFWALVRKEEKDSTPY